MQKKRFLRRYILAMLLWHGGTFIQATIGRFITEKQGDFGASAFFSGNAFYLGASKDFKSPGKYAVVEVSLVKDAQNNPCSVNFNSLACERVADVNRDSCNKEHASIQNFANPVYNQSIAHMALLGALPVVVLASDTVEPKLGAHQKIAVLFGPQKVQTNVQVINAANGLPASSIAGIAAGSIPCIKNKEPCRERVIFAAVAPRTSEYGNTFGDFESGIAVLISPDEGPLKVTDAQRGYKFANRAVRISLAPGELTAIDQESRVLGIGKMYWDSTLERLYVPLHVTRSDNSMSGGVVALAVGRLTCGVYGIRLTLEPAVGLSSSNFDLNSDEHIVGFFRNDATAAQTALHHVKILHTSTGKSYAIVNGETGVDVTHNRVYSLGLVRGCSSSDTVGKIAATNDISTVVSSAAVMPRQSGEAALVGASDLPTTPDQPITEMFTVGDTVYVMLSGASDTNMRDATHESGIFASTALFDSNGCIARWTPWRRVMGSVNSAFGGGFDCSSGSFIYLSHRGVSPYGALPYTDTVYATQWECAGQPGLLSDLVTSIARNFSPCEGGVHQIYNFDQTTPTFSQDGMVDSLSLMIATGHKKVALIETGNHDGMTFNPNAGVFGAHTQKGFHGQIPNPNASARMLVVSGGALDEIGPISSSEISRSPRVDMTQNGWIFVGGYGGLAVASQDNGDGWDTSLAQGLKRGFVGLNDTFSFKKVGEFSDVRKIVSDDTFLYVLTRTQLVRIPLDPSNFSTAGAMSPTIVELASADDLTGVSCSSFRDMIISGRMAIIATNAGLYRVGDGRDIALAASPVDLNWTVVLAGGVNLGPVYSLTMISATSNDDTQGGNLYALTSYEGSSISLVHRFSLRDTSLDPITNSTLELIPMSVCQPFFISFGKIWSQFQTDGTQIFLGRSPRVCCGYELSSFCLQPCLSGIVDRGCAISLDDTCDAALKNLGQLRRNSASGAWIVPSHTGIRTHE